jgi:hypothetical protein
MGRTNNDASDLAAERDIHEGIRQGLEDIAHGRTRPAQEVFDEMRGEFGIPLPPPDRQPKEDLA